MRSPPSGGKTDKPKKVRFTYSTEDQPLIQRAVIQAIEKMGGQRKLKKLYVKHQSNIDAGEDFFKLAMRILKLNVEFNAEALRAIPATGPLVFISNHPYGVMDGITLTWLVRKIRPDVKVLANSVLCQAPEAAQHLLPVDFAPTRESPRDQRAVAPFCPELAAPGPCHRNISRRWCFNQREAHEGACRRSPLGALHR